MDIPEEPINELAVTFDKELDNSVKEDSSKVKEEPKEEKSSKGTGLFGLFKKKEEIEKNVENNAIEEIFAYKNNGPYIPTEEKKTEEENTKSNLDFEKNKLLQRNGKLPISGTFTI